MTKAAIAIIVANGINNKDSDHDDTNNSDIFNNHNHDNNNINNSKNVNNDYILYES